MDPITLRELMTVKSSPAALPPAPAKTVTRVYPGVPQREDSIEVQRLQDQDIALSSHDGPSPGDDVEMSRPPSPESPTDGVEIQPSIWEPYMNRYRFMSACILNFQNGVNDSAPGALIPYMEK